MTQWDRIGIEGLPVQVVPVRDIREHVEDPLVVCPCMPRLLEDGKVVAHNSYDGREIGEVCRNAINALGVALAHHNHQWTDVERDHFDHATLILDMHYPLP